MSVVHVCKYIFIFFMHIVNIHALCDLQIDLYFKIKMLILILETITKINYIHFKITYFLLD